MNLIDGNITLRAVEQGDNCVLKSLVNDPEVEARIGGWSFPSSDERQAQWYQSIVSGKDRSKVRFAVDIGGNCIGMAALHGIDYKNSHAQVDIKLVKDARGKGVGCAVIRMLEKYAFEELNLHMLISEILEHNGASRRAFEKAGFRLDGVMRNRVYKNGTYQGQCAYSLLKQEYILMSDKVDHLIQDNNARESALPGKF